MTGAVDLSGLKQRAQQGPASGAPAGVEVTEWSLPAELNERHEGRSITHDDVLDFHALLETADWFERLSSMVQS